MSFTRRAAPALIFLVLTTGCAAKKTIIGKWSGTAPISAGRQPGMPATVPMTFDFKPDNTATVNASLAMGASSMQIVMQEKYTVKGETLTMTPTSMTLNGRPIPVSAAMSASTPMPYKLEGDKLTITRGGETSTLTRVKQ